MRKCLDSILAQTFQDYECLLIDDGSKDGSPVICEEYAAKDPRFKAFHKPNGGLSDARNYGLERAKGEYTIFFDPDDWVDEACLKDMYAKSQETDADMVMCDIFYNDAYTEKYSKQEPQALDHFSVLEDIIADRVQGFTVIKLIRRSLYTEYEILYPIGMYGCEDQYTICKLLKNDIKIAYLPNAYYHYMHYGNPTQSRRYDENTYLHDVMIRDMFVELLAETPYKQLAYNRKSRAIVARAFYFGYNIYDSKKFKERFMPYKSLFVSERSVNNAFIFISLKGNYHIARFVYGQLYNAKQFFKYLIKMRVIA